MSRDLERRYRRVLRLLPRWYREQWEENMIAAFLDSWLTGDPEADEYISKAAGPSAAEVASVVRLAVRLHLGGPGTPRRHAWGQAIRRAVLAVLLVHAVLDVDILAFLVRSHRLVNWLPPPPASVVIAPGGAWDMAYYLAGVAWIVIFVTLALGHYRTARVLAALAIVPNLVALLQAHSPASCRRRSGRGPSGFCSALPRPTPPAARPGQRAGRGRHRARRGRLRPNHSHRAGPGAREPAAATPTGVTDHRANRA